MHLVGSLLTASSPSLVFIKAGAVSSSLALGLFSVPFYQGGSKQFIVRRLFYSSSVWSQNSKGGNLERRGRWKCTRSK